MLDKFSNKYDKKEYTGFQFVWNFGLKVEHTLSIYIYIFLLKTVISVNFNDMFIVMCQPPQFLADSKSLAVPSFQGSRHFYFLEHCLIMQGCRSFHVLRSSEESWWVKKYVILIHSNQSFLFTESGRRAIQS